MAFLKEKDGGNFGLKSGELFWMTVLKSENFSEAFVLGFVAVDNSCDLGNSGFSPILRSAIPDWHPSKIFLMVVNLISLFVHKVFDTAQSIPDNPKPVHLVFCNLLTV